MIELTRRDVGKQVECRLENGQIVVGKIVNFDAEAVFVRASGEIFHVARRRVSWPVEEGNPNAASARALLQKAGCYIEPADEHHWRVSLDPAQVFLFWPATGFWRWPDGRTGGGGPLRLIEAAGGRIN